MLQHLIIQLPLYYLSSNLWEVKNNRKFLTFSSRSGCGRLHEVPNVMIWLGNFWYFGKLVTEERWWLTRGGHNWRFDCSRILLNIFSMKCSVTKLVAPCSWGSISSEGALSADKDFSNHFFAIIITRSLTRGFCPRKRDNLGIKLVVSLTFCVATYCKSLVQTTQPSQVTPSMHSTIFCDHVLFLDQINCQQ